LFAEIDQLTGMNIRKINSFREVFSEIDGGRILDVACGEGQFIEILQTHLRSWEHITGLDVEKKYLQMAAGRFQGERYSFISGSSLKMPFADCSFDLVSLSNGLHHVGYPDVALDEMQRVLKTGGYMVINEMYSNRLTASQISHRLYHHLHVEVDKIFGVNHFFTFRREEILRLVRRLNLSDQCVYEYQEDQDDPMNAERIEEQSAKLDRMLEQLGDHEKYDYFYHKVEELKKRFRKVGFSRVPQLVIIGRCHKEN
jgi:ubiquinone/menaquinone biosynthesis C-methylase UbiE